MDKNGNVLKAIVPAPNMAPIRGVEYGCEHLQEFMVEDASNAVKLKNAYAEIQTELVTNPVEAHTTRDSKDPKKETITTLKPTFLCLQCKTISSAKDRDVHGQNRRHYWSIESRSGCLYCGQCDDFIYDPSLERIRIQQNLPSALNGKKRKFSSLYPQGEEDKFDLANSNQLSCMAGGPRGIYNLGNTCYMSVILQAFIHNPLMRNFFLSCRHDTSECPVENCAACTLSGSFTDILATEKTDGHGPLELLYKSWKHNELLAGDKQQDAHEYFQSLLNQLHESCGCIAPAKACECLYHQTFFGRLRSTVTCLTCHNVTKTSDPIIDLSLDLYQQAKRRKVDPKKPNVDAPLDLWSCLKSFTTPEKLQADEYRCGSETCKKTTQRAKKHLTIKKLPPAMCIQLKRYEHGTANAKKLTIRCNFPLQLDMTPYTTAAFKQAQKYQKHNPNNSISSPLQTSNFPSSLAKIYDLSAVVVHHGEGTNAGHYKCFCKRDDQWFEYNDQKVMLASEKQVLGAEAYLLFYIVRDVGDMGEKKAVGERGNGGVEKMEMDRDDDGGD